MKKVFSLFATFVAATMLSFAADVTIAGSAFEGQGVSGGGDDSAITLTQDGVTVSCTNGYGTDKHVRMYKNSIVTISAEENIASIAFTFSGNYTGGLETSISVGSKEWSSDLLASQARITEIVVTLGEGGGEGGGDNGGDNGDDNGENQGGEQQEVINITVAQAIEMAQAGSTATVNIEGYVLGVYGNNGEYSEQYDNQSFYMGDTANDEPIFVAYRVKGTDVKATIPVGTKVRIENATLTVYKETPETNAGATVTIIEGGNQGGGTEVVIPDDAITAAEAVALLENGTVDADADYTVVAYVTRVLTTEADYAKYSNLNFYVADTKDGGDVLEVYRGNVPSYLTVGSKVMVVGKLTVFTNNSGTTIYEFAQGANVTILEAAEQEEPKTIQVNVAGALEAIAGFADTNASTDTYVVTGVVVEVTSNDIEQYGNVTFTMADAIDDETTLLAYRVKTDVAPCPGAKVIVTGKLQNYRGNTPEIAAGATLEIVEQGECASDEVIEIEADNYYTYDENFAEYGALAFAVYSEAENVGVWVYVYPESTTELDGTYDFEEGDGAIYTDWADEDADGIEITGGSLTYTTNDDGTVTIEVTAVTAEGTYHIVYVGEAEVVEPVSYELNPDDFSIDTSYFDSYGDVTVLIYDTEAEKAVAIDILPTSAEDITGSYSVEDNTIDLDYSAFYTDFSGNYVDLEDATITIELTDGVYIISGTYTIDGVTYEFEYEGLDPEVQYAEPEQATSFEIELVGLEYTDENLADYGTVRYFLNNANEDQIIVLELVTSMEEVNAEYPLPVGEYSFAGQAGDGQFWTGEIYNGSPYPAFLAVANGEDYLYYYIVDGSVVVTLTDAAYTIAINVTTQNGSTIVAEYVKSITTGIETVTVNGLDVNAPVYNVLGQKVDAQYKGIVIQNGQKFLNR